MRDQLKKAKADNALLISTVQASEWHEPGGESPYCPMCWQYKETGHDPSCALINILGLPHPGAALLKELEGLRRVNEAAGAFIRQYDGCLNYDGICNINECYLCEHKYEGQIEDIKQALANLEKGEF